MASITATPEKTATIILRGESGCYSASLKGKPLIHGDRSEENAAIAQMIYDHRDKPEFREFLEANPTIFADKDMIQIGKLVRTRGLAWGLEVEEA